MSVSRQAVWECDQRPEQVGDAIGGYCGWKIGKALGLRRRVVMGSRRYEGDEIGRT